MNKKLKEIREKRQLTQVQVAQLVGISTTSYQRIEYAKQDPSLKTARKIVEVLNTTLDVFK